MSEKQPDWDKITEGKIRHGVAVEAFSKGMELNTNNMKEIEKWVQFIIHGYHGIKEIVDSKTEVQESKPLTDKELVTEVKEKFDGKEIDADKHIIDTVEKAVVGLDVKNKNKVMYQLKNGNITMDNLGACLDRIKELKKV